VAQRLYRYRFNLRNLNELEVRKQFKVEITNTFAVLENLKDDVDVSCIWGNMKHNIQISAKESLSMHEWNQHKPFFDEECLGFLDQSKRAKIQWVQDPYESNVGNLNSARREVSRHFRKKKKEYLRSKIEELEANSKIHNVRDLFRGINNFKKGYQPRCNIVKDEKSDLLAQYHSIMVRWRKYFSHLFIVHGMKDVGQAETQKAEPLVPEPSAFEFVLAIDKLKSHK